VTRNPDLVVATQRTADHSTTGNDVGEAGRFKEQWKLSPEKRLSVRLR